MVGKPGSLGNAVPLEIESHPEYDSHEQVLVRDGDDFTAIIALHSTRLGPAAGGCRIFPYGNLSEAIGDVLRLSRGMSYKSAMAGLPFGGGKSVIVADPATDKTRTLLHQMGDFIDSLGGNYIAAEDSGSSVDDMRVMAERTTHVSGIAEEERHGGDPSPVTARGVFLGIRSAVRHRLGCELDGVSVAVQGIGNVGWHLIDQLCAANARVVVADTCAARAERAVERYGVRSCAATEIHRIEAEIFAPCALGGAINARSVEELQAQIVAGAANNQLTHHAMGDRLHERGILYAPDYVINAGGIIDVYYQRKGLRQPAVVGRHLGRIVENLEAVLTAAERDGLPPHRVADSMARDKIQAGIAEVAA